MTKVLIVDDADYIVDIISQTLERENLGSIEVARDGDEALKVFKSFQPDLVIIDILMPERDGISTIKEMVQGQKQCKIIAITSLGKASLKKQVLEAGADRFLTKPLQMKTMVSIIKEVLGETQAA